MCGIAGFLYKSDIREGPIGEQLLAMASTLGSRGTDSTGMALNTPDRAGLLTLTAYFEHLDVSQAESRSAQVLDRVAALALVEESALVGDLLHVAVRDVSENADPAFLRRLTDAVESSDGAKVFSIGRNLQIIKDVGAADQLERQHEVASIVGTHGIAHTRLATESRVDVCHSHPFWARPFPDIAVVHNGQLTNHHTLRRRFVRMGYDFMTENDSEVIAIYVADRLSRGATLEEALADSLDELDGTFTYLVSTDDSVGLAKDRFATKPLVVAENDRYVAMASEEVALNSVFTADSVVYEPPARAVQTWSR